MPPHEAERGRVPASSCSPDARRTARDGATVRRLVAWALSQSIRRTVAEAAGNRNHVHLCGTRAEFLEQVRRLAPEVIVVELGAHVRAEAGVGVRHAIAACPAARVVGICQLGPHAAAAVWHAVRGGLHALVFEGVDDVEAELRRALAQRCGPLHQAAILADVVPLFPAHLRDAAEYLVRAAHRAPTVGDLADALGTARRTTLRYFAKAGLPAPAVVMLRIRLLYAAKILETGSVSVEHAAKALGFPSARAFRIVLRRELGLCPTELRSAGSYDTLVRRFSEHLARPVNAPSAPADLRDAG